MTQAANDKPQIAGLCWIRPDQWDRLLEVAEDSDRLETTWDEWQEKSLEMIEVFATRGILIEKVDVDIEALIAWCQDKEKPVNASTRAEYVTALMMEQKKQQLSNPTQH